MSGTMGKTYLEISVSAGERQREMLIPTMVELGCEGFQETDNALLCYIDKSRWSDAQAHNLESALRDLLHVISANAAVTIREIPETNWNADWEQSIQPINVGDRFLISPSWHNPPNPDNRMMIRIDPKMSFGTGYHETTRLVVCLLEKHTRPGMRMLDVGTGTGILAIAAVKLGAVSAEGIDNDEWSISNGAENTALNGVDRAVRISDTTLDAFGDGSFDLIAANITLNTNIGMLPDFRRLLCPGGTAILSGFLETDRDTILKAVQQNNFELTGQSRENEWLALAIRKLP
jgi:ribosomal protein L11 methyltransferase